VPTGEPSQQKETVRFQLLVGNNFYYLLGFVFKRQGVAVEEIIDTQAEAHQLMLERMQVLEKALDRAEVGIATRDDWDIIRMECGMPRRLTAGKLHRSE
jgi:hypothetical protein